MNNDPAVDFASYVDAIGAAGNLAVQPRMGVPDPGRMALGMAAVANASAQAVGTITLDSYTRVGDHEAARAALRDGRDLNGFPLVAHGPDVTAGVVAGVRDRIPVQVRHGSAQPGRIFDTMAQAGLYASEGGPVSYCLPYGRTRLTDSVRSWRAAASGLAMSARERGTRAHLETFGGCMLGQLCPPSLLVALSVLEAAFFAQQGVSSVSLSYAQQTHAVQDIEALAALRHLAAKVLPPGVNRHLVVYTYMGVYPSTVRGAERLLTRSAEIAVRGGAQRLIVKTTAEAQRIPTIRENVVALKLAERQAAWARHGSALPWHDQVDYSDVLAEAGALVQATLELSDDVGRALLRAFATGLLDVPFCVHQDNRGLTQGFIDQDGRLRWAQMGRLPLPNRAAMRGSPVRARQLLAMLWQTAHEYDQFSVKTAPGLPLADGPLASGECPDRSVRSRPDVAS